MTKQDVCNQCVANDPNDNCLKKYKKAFERLEGYDCPAFEAIEPEAIVQEEEGTVATIYGVRPPPAQPFE